MSTASFNSCLPLQLVTEVNHSLNLDARMQKAEGNCSLLFKPRQSSHTIHRCKLENSWGSMWNPSMLLPLKHLSIKDWIQLAQPFEEAFINSTRKLLWKTTPDMQASWPKILPWKGGSKGLMENSLLNNGSLQIIELCHSSSPLKIYKTAISGTSSSTVLFLSLTFSAEIAATQDRWITERKTTYLTGRLHENC